MQSNLQQIQYKNISWTHVTKPTDEDLSYLQEKYGFHPLDIADVKTVSQRPKIDEYSNYLFMVLLFAYHDKNEQEIEATEINIFIGATYLVTATDGRENEVENFFNECQHDESIKQLYMSGHPVQLLHELLHRLQSQTYPMLDHISMDMEKIEKQLFAGNEKRMVREILAVRRNIVAFRRIMQSHKNIIKKLVATRTKFFMPDEMADYFNENLERSKDIWDYLETHKDTIDAYQQTNESLISFKLNDIMKILTIISVILIPANLVASIFGMNTTQAPLTHDPNGFWYITGIIALVIFSFLIWFKKKDWL